MKISEFIKDKLTISIFEILLVLVFVLVLVFSFLYNQLNGGNLFSKKTVTYARQEKNPQTYFDAVLVSFDTSKNSILVEVTKDGFTQRLDKKLDSNIKLSRVTYDSKDLKVETSEKISQSELKSGQSLRLFVSQKATDFDLSHLTEIQVLVGK